jgi:hypothetical protein
MSNGRTRFTRHKPNTRWDAYDALPPLTRQALQEGPQQWCDIWVSKHIKKLRKQHPTASMESIDKISASIIWRWHLHEIAEAKPWQPTRKPYERKPLYPAPSPHIAAGAVMQLSNR